MSGIKQVVPMRKDHGDLVKPPEEFYRCVINNDLEKVEAYLNSDYDYDARRGSYHDPDTALTLASDLGHTEMVQKLVTAGSDVNIACRMRKWTPLMYAAFHGHVTILDLLLANGADPNHLDGSHRSALFLASGNSQACAVERLCAHATQGIDARCRFEPVPRWAREKLNAVGVTSAAILSMTSPYTGNTPLLKACWNNDVHVTSALLHRGADVNVINDLGDAALHVAARGGFYDVTRTLLERSVPDLDLQNNLGETPLHVACRALFSENLTGATLTFTALQNITKVIQTLISSGSDVTIADVNGQSPLHTLLTGNFTILGPDVKSTLRLRFLLIQQILSATPPGSAPDLPQEKDLSRDLVAMGHSRLLQWLVDFFKSPRSLQRLCEQRVRACVGPERFKSVISELLTSPAVRHHTSS